MGVHIGLGEALIIFLGLLILNIMFVFVNLFKKGELVKNILLFGFVQVYIIAMSIFIFYENRKEGNILTYIIGTLFIIAAIAAVVLRSINFKLARYISAESVILTYTSYWYSENHLVLLIISLLVYAITVGYLVYKDKRGY